MKKLLVLFVLAAGWPGFAGTIDVSNAQAMVKSLVGEIKMLKPEGVVAFASALDVLSEMPEAEAVALLGGKTPDEVVAAVKEKYPEKFEHDINIFRWLTPDQLAAVADKLTAAASAVKEDSGFQGVNGAFGSEMRELAMPLICQSAVNLSADMDEARALDFFTALMTVLGNRNKDTGKVVEVLFYEGAAAFVAKARELDAEAFTRAAGRFAALSEAERKKVVSAMRSNLSQIAAAGLAKPEEVGEVAWVADFAAAGKQAAAENKHLFVLFTGSDWCPYCIKLEKEFLGTKKFADYVSTRFVPVLVDFPRSRPLSSEQTAANQALAEKYEVKGYPTILLMTADGKVIGKFGYKRGITVAQFIAGLNAQLDAAAEVTADK
ncbi:MAG: thioredoxin family protein [Victivallaceae bacterium]|nr:thioredoxin family protein [Victivallaceae bacterium]